MLYVNLITVGDLPKGPFEKIATDLKTQLRPFVKLTHTIYKDQTRAEESSTNADILIVLEANGPNLTSEAFAQKIKTYEDNGDHITVLLGGAKGLSDEIKSRADFVLSLSPLTFPHDFAHILFLEQLYRAMTIIRGKTYHY